MSEAVSIFSEGSGSFNGTFRDWASGKIEKFSGGFDLGLIRVTFVNPSEVLTLDANAKPFVLRTVRDGTTKNFKRDSPLEKFRESALSYSDLALNYLSWPDPKVIEEAYLKTRKCWILWISRPAKEINYPGVKLWVEQSSRALVQMEGYDSAGNVEKRIEFSRLERASDGSILGGYRIKQLKIEAFDYSQGKRRLTLRTYIDLNYQ